MPLYEYYCPNCDKNYEKLQKISDPALEICEFCEKTGMQRLVSAAGFRLKGTGWYETDFKNPKKPEDKKKQDNKDNGKINSQSE